MLTLITRSLAAHRGRLLLTMVAVTLSVGFITASFVLADSLRAVFGDISASIYDDVDAEIRAADGDFDQLVSGDRFAQADLEATAGIDGVSSIVPSLGARDLLFTVNAAGQLVRPAGPPTLTFSASSDGEAAPFSLVAGDWPGAGQVALDSAQAEVLGIEVGDPVAVAVPAGEEAFTLSGTVTFGDTESGAIPYFLLFDLPTTQQLLGAPGLVDAASIIVDQGADVETTIAAVAAALPDGLVVADRSELVQEQEAEFRQVIDIIQMALLGFALVTLIVSTFVIANTFAVLVGQQRRQIGMLRAIGANGAQAVGLVVAEAALVGLLASGLGIGAGVGVAELIKTLFESVTNGAGFPEGPTLITPRTIAVAICVGIGVTVLSALVPALRAGRTSPMEALRSTDSTTRRRSRILAPLVGATIGRLGPAGELAAGGVSRNPRRVFTTAMSMIVGMAIIGAITVLASSYQATVADSTADAYDGEVVITGVDGVAVPYTAMAGLAELPEVAAASGIGATEVLVDGEITGIVGHQPERAEGVVVLSAIAGSTDAIGDDQVIVTAPMASQRQLDVGDWVPVGFSDGALVELEVAAIIEETVAVDGDLLVDAGLIAAHARNVDAGYGVVRLVDGVTTDEGIAAVEAALAGQPQLDVSTMNEWVEARGAIGSQLAALANGLLALTIVVALVGIANTITLSMLERRRELGLLRAVGLSRRQLRAMVGYEAATLATIGAASGLLLGVAAALTAAPFIPASAIGSIQLPLTSLAAYLGIAIVLGVAAAILPARRLERMPVLDALSGA